MFHYLLNKKENSYTLRTDLHKEKKMIGNTDCHLHCNSDISASQQANKHKENVTTYRRQCEVKLASTLYEETTKTQLILQMK